MLRFIPFASLLVFCTLVPSSSSFFSTATGAFYLDWLRDAASVEPEVRWRWVKTKRATSHSTNWGKRAAASGLETGAALSSLYPDRDTTSKLNDAQAASKRILLFDQDDDDRRKDAEEPEVDTGFGDGVYRTNIADQSRNDKPIQFYYNLGKVKTSQDLKKAREDILRWFFWTRFPRYRGKRRLGMIQKSPILPSDVNFCHLIQELSRRVCLYILRHSDPTSINLRQPQLCEGSISRCIEPGSKRQIGQLFVPDVTDGAGKKYRKIFVRI